MKKRLTADEWSRFWEQGSITTFVGGFSDNYDGEVLAFWRSFLQPLDEGAHLLDLATGNGALAALAAQFAMEWRKSFVITGVDFADIDPSGRARASHQPELLQQITFLGRTRIEDTGLPPASVDCAISQFGFEYSEREETLAELARVLKSKSTIGLMMHHRDSDVLRQAREGLEQCSVCSKSRLQDKIAELLKHLDLIRRQGKQSSHQSEALRAEANGIAAFLDQASGQFRDPSHLQSYLRNSLAVFGKAFAGRSLGEKLGFLSRVEAELRAYQVRMEDLVNAGMTDSDIGNLEKDLERLGFRIAHSDWLTYQEQAFAYTLAAGR